MIYSWKALTRTLTTFSLASSGDIIFYDKKVSGTCRQMGAVRCPAVTAEWSPDGRHLLTATTAPRLRVDNSMKTFTYFGKQARACVCICVTVYAFGLL